MFFLITRSGRRRCVRTGSDRDRIIEASAEELKIISFQPKEHFDPVANAPGSDMWVEESPYEASDALARFAALTRLMRGN